MLALTGSVEAAATARPDELCALGEPALARAVAARPALDIDAQLDPLLRWLDQQDESPRRVVALGDAHYPRLLLESPDPPLLLYAQGRIELLAQGGVAIVGSRNATAQGHENARAFATELSRHGVTVVSGLALGIDGAAHEGALEGPGSTIAVVATGLDRVYPKRHLALAHRIARAGLLVSEHPLGTPPLAAHFPQRNRIIAGLTLGTLVVEAAVHSGSLITARLALESGREVFAIPGSIHSPHAKGCHVLIKQGAKLVERASDIVEELPAMPWLPSSEDGDAALTEPSRMKHRARESETERKERDSGSVRKDAVLDALSDGAPRTLDDLAARTGLPAATLQARLLELELEGRVARMPGQMFQQVHRA